MEAPSLKELDAADKLALQGYGRPYVDGKPGGHGKRQKTSLPIAWSSLELLAFVDSEFLCCNCLCCQAESTTSIQKRQDLYHLLETKGGACDACACEVG